MIFDSNIDVEFLRSYIEIESRYQLNLIEIRTDKDHVHFLVQLVPRYSVTKIVTIIKSITAMDIFKFCL